jgi:uncharacterized protein
VIAEKISSDLKDALRAKDAARLTLLRALKSAIQYREIKDEEAGKPKLDEAGTISVVQQQIKQRKDSVAQFEAAGRPELAATEKAEIALLEGFLPQQLSDEELAALVQEAVLASGAKDPKQMGAVMKLVTPKVAGRAEGRRVSDAVKKALSGA